VSMKSAIALFATALTLILPATATARPLTRPEMKSLAWAGVHSICPTLKRSVVGFETRRVGHYVSFEAVGDLPGSGSIHPCSPFYVIDPATGDMWDGVSACGSITSPAIRRLQMQFRARIGLSAARYNRIRRHGPMCDQR